MTQNHTPADHPRKSKKFWRGHVTHVERAYCFGQDHGYRGLPKKNPYPKGRRHAAYDYGYNGADPMGQHHKSND